MNTHLLKLLQVLPCCILIKKHSYTICHGLTIYKAKRLESIFLDAFTNVLQWTCVPLLNINVNPLLENVSKEQNKKNYNGRFQY